MGIFRHMTLDQKTRTVFRLRDIIFEEDTTHLAK